MIKIQEGAGETQQTEENTQEVMPIENEKLIVKEPTDENTGGEQGDTDGAPEQKAIAPMPENGSEKYYDKKTGEYDYASERKELLFRISKKRAKEDGKPENAGAFDFDSVAREYTETGEISEESKELLKKKGIPENVIDNYVEGIRAKGEMMVAKQAEYAGGKSKLDAILKYAASTMTPEQISDANKDLSSANAWETRMDSLILRFHRGNKTAMETNDPIVGDNLSNTGGSKYRTYAELSKDINSIKYAKSEKYQNEVMQKAIRSGMRM